MHIISLSGEQAVEVLMPDHYRYDALHRYR